MRPRATAAIVAAACLIASVSAGVIITRRDALAVPQDGVNAAAETGVTDISQVGSIELTGITDAYGNSYSGTGPDGRHIDGKPIEAIDRSTTGNGATIRFSLKGSIDLDKVKPGDRIGIRIGTSDENGKFNERIAAPDLSGPDKLTDAAGNVLFNVTWKAYGFDYNIMFTRTDQAGIGQYKFTMHNGISVLEQYLNEKTKPAGKVKFTLDGKSWTLDYAEWKGSNDLTPHKEQCNTPVAPGYLGTPEGGLHSEEMLFRLILEYQGCADQNRVLAGQAPQTDTKDLIFFIKINKPDFGEIKNIAPEVLNLDQSGLYDATTLANKVDGNFVYNYRFQWGIIRSQAQPSSAEEAAGMLKPNEYAAFPNNDGSYTLAYNLGPRQGADSLHPTLTDVEDPLSSPVSDEADKAAIKRLIDANMSSTSLSAGFGIYPKDRDTGLRADATVTELVNGVAKKSDFTVLSDPGSMRGQGQLGIMFDANGGTGEMDDLIGDASPNVQLPANTFARKGYTFAGWNTKQDGTGTTYQPGADYRFTTVGSITLYAQWSANPATITFDGNARNVTGATKPLATHYDAEENLPANGYKRDGYTFTGWSTKPGDNTADYADGAKYKVTVDATLYAQWKADPASLFYDANGGDADSVPAKQTGVTDQTVTIGKAPSRTGYTFAGWSMSADGTGIILKPGDVYRLHGDATLHAKWTANDITIRYDANADNVTGIMQDQTTKADQPLKLTPSTYTRPGYRFTGWSTTSTGTNQDGTPVPRYDDGASITTSTDTTLYAQWARTDGESIIWFSPNTTGRYTGRMPDLVVRNNEPTSLTKNLYRINGKYFTGWNTNTDGTGTTYEDGASITTSTDVTLYAQWSSTPTKPEIKPGDNDNNKPGNENNNGNNPDENGNNNPGDNNQNNNGNKPGDNGNNNQNGNGNNPGTGDGNNNGGSNQTSNGNNPGSGDGNNDNGSGNKPETNTNGNGTTGDADKTNGTDKANTNKGNSLARTGSAIAGVLTTAMLALAAGVTALTAKLRRRDTK